MLKSKKHKTLLISLILFLIIIINAEFLCWSTQFIQNRNNKFEDSTPYDLDVKISNGEDFLFQGIESSLNVTDIGNLYELNQEIVGSNLEEIDLTYFIDETRNWKVSKIENNIKDIYDTKNWINNSGFQPVTIFREYQVFASSHNPYASNRDRLTTDNLIQELGALYIRAHFTNVSFHNSGIAAESDHLYIYNSTYYEYLEFTGSRDDFYSPWVSGDTLDICYQSDNQNNDYYGYRIDYYEFVNSSSNLNANLKNWKFRFNPNTPWGANTMSSGVKHGVDAMFLGYHGDWANLESFIYYADTYSEMYQDNIQIPRGNLIDAYISFDYLLEFGFDTNNIIMYLEVNGKKIYSKGMLDIATSGKNIWHSTGNVPLYLWENLTNVFDYGNFEDQPLNISLGIKNLGSGVQYTGYEDVFGNIVWFDNISLVLTTVANSSQNGINLTINSINLSENNKWGNANVTLNGIWDTDPIILTVNTTSPSLSFKMNTTLYGYHETLSSYNQFYDQGVSYEILDNGTIFWELYHYLYMPNTYENFEFKIKKPINWEFVSVLDPFLQTRYFEDGKNGDEFVLINKSNAIFAGWYTLRATSPNYLNTSNIKILKQGQWVQNATFTTGESTQITSQLNYMNDIPKDVGNIDLTIYYPNGTIFYEESKSPVDGNVTFSQVTFGVFNTSGGIYEYTLFWSNSTALGGLRSSFLVVHDSYLTILKPDDARDDNTTGATIGDIIPLRVYLRDAENNLPISNALISYNWTTGTKLFIEAALGIYETLLVTSELGGFGLYNIVINSSKLGFINSNLTLMINLGENTNLQRLESDSKIVIHENSTIRFFYYSEFDDEGIPGAQVSVNISNPLFYMVQDLSGGIYSIEFSTEFISNIGIYRLVFEFTAIGYQPQIHIYQFEIIDPPTIPEGPNIWLWAILFASIAVGAIFAALSLRSYVLLPRKRKKEAELLAKTQRFKDLKNIQAIVVIHKLSGIPIYSKSYSILEKHKKELFAGFIQAITMIGEEFAEKEITKSEIPQTEKSYGVQKMIELNFKQFYCLIADIADIRVVLILKERSSERLKSELSNLVLALNLKLSAELENWDGALDDFEIIVPQIINEYFDLYYKESFRLSGDINLITMKKEKKLTKMEMRVVNVLQSMSKDNLITDINHIVELVHEENKDLIIEAIENLIKQKIIIPLSN